MKKKSRKKESEKKRDTSRFLQSHFFEKEYSSTGIIISQIKIYNGTKTSQIQNERIIGNLKKGTKKQNKKDTQERNKGHKRTREKFRI
jgi:hypothetical protein